MSAINVYRPVDGEDEGAARQVWRFEMISGHLSLRSYHIERRSGGRGRWRNPDSRERWTFMDERSYYSGLSRPAAIPRDVAEEAISKVRMPPIFIVNDGAELDEASGEYRVVNA